MTSNLSFPATSTAISAGSLGDDVVLVDDYGSVLGTAPRGDVHDAHTPLHLAFSLHLLDPNGRTLLTRRALSKRTWPGVWTNSCCGHLRPGESATEAVRRRTREELGVELGVLHAVLPDFRYRAVDATGVVEHEICPVHVARVEPDVLLSPDPEEVAEHAWVRWEDLHGAVTRTPFVFSPWFATQVLTLGPSPSWPADAG